MIGHTSVVNCLARAGSNKDEEYLVSSSENGYNLFLNFNESQYNFVKILFREMKLWEINQRKCVENIKMSNTIHKNIYVI